MEKNVLLTIEYDGSDFFGWQRQPDRPTVQGYIERSLSSLFRREITINGTSRTDAGVHAYGQRASFKADIGIPEEKLALVINNSLKRQGKNGDNLSPVRVTAAEEKPADFHARFDAKGKKYIYRIKNSLTMNVFERNYVYHVSVPLNLEKMRAAAGYLKGVHDFKSFEASGGTPRETTIRNIFDIDIMAVPLADAGAENGWERILEIHVSGDGFLYNMVRIISGTLVDIGTGKIEAEMHDIITAKDRSVAGHTAPPGGLYLAEVYY